MPSKSDEWIYIIQHDAPDGLIKIGYTTHPEKRLFGLQMQSAVPLALLNIILGTRETEQHIHSKLDTHRAHGEWFYPHQQVLDAIEQTKAWARGQYDSESHARVMRQCQNVLGVPPRQEYKNVRIKIRPAEEILTV